MESEIFTLTNAKIIDPVNDLVDTGSITIESGKILYLNGKSLGKEINCNGKYLAPGIIDMGVKICEPGERHKESFKSAGAAAAAGGITTMVTQPDTIPTIDTPEMLEEAINEFLPEDSQVDLSGVDNFHREALAAMINFVYGEAFIGMSDDVGYCMVDYLADNSGDSHRDILVNVMDAPTISREVV